MKPYGIAALLTLAVLLVLLPSVEPEPCCNDGICFDGDAYCHGATLPCNELRARRYMAARSLPFSTGLEPLGVLTPMHDPQDTDENGGVPSHVKAQLRALGTGFCECSCGGTCVLGDDGDDDDDDGGRPVDRAWPCLKASVGQSDRRWVGLGVSFIIGSWGIAEPIESRRTSGCIPTPLFVWLMTIDGLPPSWRFLASPSFPSVCLMMMSFFSSPVCSLRVDSLGFCSPRPGRSARCFTCSR
jgi:hypothetical protein